MHVLFSLTYTSQQLDPQMGFHLNGESQDLWAIILDFVVPSHFLETLRLNIIEAQWTPPSHGDYTMMMLYTKDSHSRLVLHA